MAFPSSPTADLSQRHGYLRYSPFGYITEIDWRKPLLCHIMHKSHFQYYSCQKGFILQSSWVRNEKGSFEQSIHAQMLWIRSSVLGNIGRNWWIPKALEKSLRPRSFPLVNEKASFIHHLKVFILSTFRRICPSPSGYLRVHPRRKRNTKPTLHPSTLHPLQ